MRPKIIGSVNRFCLLRQHTDKAVALSLRFLTGVTHISESFGTSCTGRLFESCLG